MIKSMRIDYQKAMDVQSLKSQTDLQKELIKQDTTLKDQAMQNQGDIMQELVKYIAPLAERVDQLTAIVNQKGLSVDLED